MNKELAEKLDYLRLKTLSVHWDDYLVSGRKLRVF